VTSPGPDVVEARPGPAELAEVLAVVAAATTADGVAPLSEATLLDLDYGAQGAAGRHLLARLDGVLAGYAHLDGDASAELVVHPPLRRHGVGTALVEALERIAPDGRPQIWAHGRQPGAVALAGRLGYQPERVLWQLRRSLAEPIPDEPLPESVRLRPFVPGRDEPAWVALNARAFAAHPEQGAWTVDDLLLREAEPWFDPAGFLLAERVGTGELAGFHWTKVHQADAARGTGSPSPIGEVYVLGVEPSARGLRLGPALTVAGLRHLRDLGLSEVLLYVDDDNPRAVRLYEGLGFSRWSADVRFGRSRPAG
jgi:mycothiol synthase